jgi:hypothetical protein
MIEVRRKQLSFGDGLIAEEVSDLRESWMIHADAVLADEDIVERHSYACFISIVFWRDLLNEQDNSAAQFRVSDAHERLYQSQAIRRCEKLIHVQVRVGNLHDHARLTRSSVEEERHRHLKDLGYVLQSAGANAVSSLLIFLNLLERQSKRVRKIGLAHFEHQTAHPHAAADMPVDGVKNASRHFGSHSSAIRRKFT